MKTLQQVEPRIPIQSTPSIISTPGHYYLTGDLVHIAVGVDAIVIATDNVTLDFNGFTLASLPAIATAAVRLDGARRHVTIRNGTIRGGTTVSIAGSFPSRIWSANLAGFSHGIIGSDGGNRSIRIERMNVNGTRNTLVSLGGEGHVIEHCMLSYSGNVGIAVSVSQIAHCSIVSCFSTGISGDNLVIGHTLVRNVGGSGIVSNHSVVSHCNAFENGGSGIVATRSQVVDSVARANQGSGFSLNEGSANGCSATLNAGSGITATNGHVTNCVAIDNHGSGIVASAGSVTKSVSKFNRQHGISVPNGVVAFCVANGNNLSAGSFVDINAAGSTRSGNLPGP